MSGNVKGKGRKRRLKIPKRNGKWPTRFYSDLDPELVGLKAFNHPVVKEHWAMLVKEYEPRERVVIVTPCSNVKPYPRSPASGKVRGVLRRLGLWSGGKKGVLGEPSGVEWLYFSDLLVFVPYSKAWEYPACCYEVPPSLVVGNEYGERIASIAAKVLSKIARRNTPVIAWLPRTHRKIFSKAVEAAEPRPRVVYAKYSLFSARELEEALKREVERM